MKTTPMIKFWYPGALFSEDRSEVSEHERHFSRVEVPNGAYAFQFYDKVTKEGVMEDGETITNSKSEKFSPTYYPDGEICNYEQAKVHPRCSDILLSNMICNVIMLVCFHRGRGAIDVKPEDVAYQYTSSISEEVM